MGQPSTSTLGVLGYLPGHPDFVRVRASGREVRRLEDWIERGLHQARWDMGGGFSVAYPRLYHRFLFRPDNSEQAVLGLLCASQDNHQRPFPFVAFDLLPTVAWDRQPLSLLDANHQFFVALESLVRDLGRLSHIGQIHGQVAATPSPIVAAPAEAPETSRQQTIDAEARYANFLQETVCGDLGQRGSEPTANGRGAALCQDLVSLLGNASDPRLLRQSLLIPLTRPAFARQLELRFFLSLISSLIRPYAPTLTMFWQLGGIQPGSLLLSFREPTVDGFLALLRQQESTRGVTQPGLLPPTSPPSLPWLTSATPLQELLASVANQPLLSPETPTLRSIPTRTGFRT